MADCLSGCARQYECKPLNVPGPAGQQAESFAPWVKVWMGNGVNEITVGNESFPSAGNTACIKSFEVGWIDDPETTIEILDEMGGRMQAFVDAIRKNSKGANVRETMIRFQFGWTYTTCEGIKSSIPSMPFKAHVQHIQVNYSEGKIKYNIKAGGAVKFLNVIREDMTVGEDDKPVKLEVAIARLASQCPPITVKYCRRDSDGKVKCEDGFDWVKFGKGGPLATWHADNENRIATITKWVEDFRVNNGTPDGVGVVPIWDPQDPDVLALFLDPTEQLAACGPQSRSLGTFIVNGGKCSPVIEFTPTFNWIRGWANFNAGGDTSSAGTTKSNFQEKSKRKGQEKEHCDTTGLQQQNTINQQAWRAYGPKNAWRDSQRSIHAHSKAGRMTEVGVEPIEATLKILGDPRDKFTGFQTGNSVSVVAINPFHLSGDKNKGCGDWLADPPCNAILSNKNWMILGINHSIKEGSYTTTLKLSLAAPVVNIDKDEPLGGSGSGGATVKNT